MFSCQLPVFCSLACDIHFSYSPDGCISSLHISAGRWTGVVVVDVIIVIIIIIIITKEGKHIGCVTIMCMLHCG